VVFFGDSICVGQGVSIHKGWVTRVATRIDEISSRLPHEIVVVNASVNGNTTRQALERMPYDVQSHGVDLLLVQFGMNDCNHWQSDRGLARVSEHGFAANLEEIIERGRCFGARRILLNTNHPTTRDKQPMPPGDVTYEQSNRRYNSVIREVAAQRPELVVLNDIESAIHRADSAGEVSIEDLLLDDGLHLSTAGHDIYFRIIAPQVEAALTCVLVEYARASDLHMSNTTPSH